MLTVYPWTVVLLVMVLTALICTLAGVYLMSFFEPLHWKGETTRELEGIDGLEQHVIATKLYRGRLSTVWLKES